MSGLWRVGQTCDGVFPRVNDAREGQTRHNLVRGINGFMSDTA